MMGDYEIVRGDGRTRLTLSAKSLGDDLVISIYNINAHIGAVALGEYDHEMKRASTSVITRHGHKDDAIALKSAYLISKKTKRPSCVIAGVHVDNITEEEIQDFLSNADFLVEDFLSYWEQHRSNH